MSLTEQVFTQAVLLAGQLEQTQRETLRALCTATTVSLTARLKEGLQPEDCKADFLTAASLFALAAMNSVKQAGALEQFSAGDLTIRQGTNTDAASNVLRNQAELIIAPYLKDRFAFLGV